VWDSCVLRAANLGWARGRGYHLYHRPAAALESMRE